ncbi:hypothetical protein Z043_124479 [Scleropages formosus]|uniref:Ig-like domain-containing protein n=1 Tax=Scleropages formosus TaxID=113540 RepID=A0A0P7WA05_SCLFO|nr:hypothetical protein Z043_124479 [Scleropages formosus]
MQPHGVLTGSGDPTSLAGDEFQVLTTIVSRSTWTQSPPIRTISTVSTFSTVSSFSAVFTMSTMSIISTVSTFIAISIVSTFSTIFTIQLAIVHTLWLLFRSLRIVCRWFCEGRELHHCPDIQISRDRDLHALVIAEAFEDDTGRYTCVASNCLGADNTSAEVYIEGVSSSDSEGEGQVSKSKPGAMAQTSLSTLERGGPSVTISDHELYTPRASLYDAEQRRRQRARHMRKAGEPSPRSCDSTGHTWTRGLGPAPPTAFLFPHLVTPCDNSHSVLPGQKKTTSMSLTIHSASPRRPETSPHRSSLIQTLSQPLHHRVTVQSPVSSVVLGGGTAPPVFTKLLQDARAHEGQVVVLECRVRGTPPLQVHWFREGQQIQDSPDFRILQKKPRSAAEPEEICTLVIAETFPEDGGLFTCTATNRFGSSSSAAQLTIQPASEDASANGVSADEGASFPPPPPPAEIGLPEAPPTPPGAQRLHVNELEMWPSVAALQPVQIIPSQTQVRETPGRWALADPPPDEAPPPKNDPPLPTRPKPKL